jgi:AcrR family transcriptional regulator
MVKEPSQKHIIRVAKKHFLAFGYAGARMQAIADDAGVNKALLHYYYKNKEGLFKKVFDEEAEKMITSAEQITMQDKPILEKIKGLIENDIDHLLKNPGLPMFMMREMARDPALIEKFDPSGRSKKVMSSIANEIRQAQKSGIVRRGVSVQDIFINMGALAMFPFIAKPFCKDSAQMSEKEYGGWLIERKRTVVEFVIMAIKK